MKQIQKTPDITTRLRQAIGGDVDVEGLAVFEAIALNTLPLRKNHPLYRGSRADRSLLLEMAAALGVETRPMQIQHDKEPLPVGRVFHGEVVDRGSESELRVLFFVDPTETATIAKINAGSVDQVSVSVLPKHIYNSVSGFDYLGAEADGENVWTGTDNDGNTIGQNGVYGRMVGLDQWMELSLVGMGGAQNARIVSREQSHFGSSYQKLAASGLDPNFFVLVASTETEKMDLTALVASLTDTKVELAQSTAAVATLEAAATASAARIAELEASLANAAKPDADLTAQVATLTASNETATADLTAATAALKAVATKVLAASGKPDAQIPETVAELNTLINETTEALAAALVAGGKSKDAVDDVTIAPVANLGAFRRR